MKTQLVRALSMMVLLGFAVPAALAQEPGLKQRLEQRLPALDDLRLRQIAGENNRGFLEVRGKATPEEVQLVEEENRDRSSVYEAIAARSETTKDTVGRARAKQIAAASARGVLLQDANGAWAPKP
ncbi:MAG: DUF1318 domain-containing protein [Opitutaceae bacterium]|nr:DUF1318 domain-containing protein [Opitutaceae bacterium]